MMLPRYPIYVISKGRWEKPLTAMALREMGVDFHLVVEPTEGDAYRAAFSDEVVELPFHDLGQGSIPARNWCWDHAEEMGFERHWILDDNIEQFNRMNNNLQHRCDSPAYFRAMEDWCDRYENVALAGPEYDFFCKSRCKWPPMRLNTRIYSCILINHQVSHRWRGRYNEDTDLALRCLKDGWCTALFIAFPQQKTQSMKMSGGNTEEVYGDTDERREFAESLQRQHPDVVKVKRRFGRWHHVVNYMPFKRNKLKRKDGVKVEAGINNYGVEGRQDGRGETHAGEHEELDQVGAG
jgi:hypothetical protein